MTTKKLAEEMFQNYKTQIIKSMGINSTYLEQLTKICKQLFGKYYIGTFAFDKIPSKMGKNKMLIFNLDKMGESNKEHWVAIYKYAHNKILFYDSFGRSHTKLFTNLGELSKNNLIQDSEKDAEQFGNSSICGQLCIAFLCICHNNGINYAKYI